MGAAEPIARTNQKKPTPPIEGIRAFEAGDEPAIEKKLFLLDQAGAHEKVIALADKLIASAPAGSDLRCIAYLESAIASTALGQAARASEMTSRFDAECEPGQVKLKKQEAELRESSDVGEVAAHARLLVRRSRWQEAVDWVTASLKQDNLQPAAVCDLKLSLAYAQGMLNHADEKTLVLEDFD